MRYILIDKDEYKMNNIRYAADAHALERSLASPVALAIVSVRLNPVEAHSF